MQKECGKKCIKKEIKNNTRVFSGLKSEITYKVCAAQI